MRENIELRAQLGQMQGQVNEMVSYKSLPEKMMHDNFANGVWIKQKIDVLEALTGIEAKNVYYAYRKAANGERVGEPEFKFKENSGFCERQFLRGSCKRFRLECESTQRFGDKEHCMWCNKECKCTYYCLNRPEMECYYTEDGSDRLLGKVFDPFVCFKFGYQIVADDESESIDYTIIAKCCQWYFWMRCPCDDCQIVNFDICEGEDQAKVVGQLSKHGRGCVANTVASGQADVFKVDFPQGANWRQRAMLMNAAVFIDFSLFEEKPNKKNQQSSQNF